MKPTRAADRLGLTTRQVRRLARRYAAAGPAGLISKRFNRPSDNRTDGALADAVIKILRSIVRGFWAYIGYGEAQNPTRDRFGQGDRASATGSGHSRIHYLALDLSIEDPYS